MLLLGQSDRQHLAQIDVVPRDDLKIHIKRLVEHWRNHRSRVVGDIASRTELLTVHAQLAMLEMDVDGKANVDTDYGTNIPWYGSPPLVAKKVFS